MSDQKYNTNLAAEFHVLSVLHRLGLDANIALGNKKSVDIVIVRDAGEAYTIDVKGLAGKNRLANRQCAARQEWPFHNIRIFHGTHWQAGKSPRSLYRSVHGNGPTCLQRAGRAQAASIYNDARQRAPVQR